MECNNKALKGKISVLENNLIQKEASYGSRVKKAGAKTIDLANKLDRKTTESSKLEKTLDRLSRLNEEMTNTILASEAAADSTGVMTEYFQATSIAENPTALEISSRAGASLPINFVCDIDLEKAPAEWVEYKNHVDKHIKDLGSRNHSLSNHLTQKIASFDIKSKKAAAFKVEKNQKLHDAGVAMISLEQKNNDLEERVAGFELEIEGLKKILSLPKGLKRSRKDVDMDVDVDTLDQSVATKFRF